MATKKKKVCPLPRGVCIWWKMIGLCPFIFVDNTMIEFSGARCAYTMALIIAYIILYCRAISNRVEYMLPRETTMTVVADFFGLSMECLMVISSWLYILFRQRELKKILKMFENLSATLGLIGISQSGKKSFRKLKIHLIIMNLVWISLFCTDHAMFINNKLFRYDVWLPFNFLRIVSHNVVIMFLNALLIAKNFFHLLNQKMHTLPEDLTLNRVSLRRRSKSSVHRRSVTISMSRIFFLFQNLIPSWNSVAAWRPMSCLVRWKSMVKSILISSPSPKSLSIFSLCQFYSFFSCTLFKWLRTFTSFA